MKVSCVKSVIAYIIKYLYKRSLGRHGERPEGNIKVDLKEAW
jgi:hypothetical protein